MRIVKFWTENVAPEITLCDNNDSPNVAFVTKETLFRYHLVLHAKLVYGLAVEFSRLAR